MWSTWNGARAGPVPNVHLTVFEQYPVAPHSVVLPKLLVFLLTRTSQNGRYGSVERDPVGPSVVDARPGSYDEIRQAATMTTAPTKDSRFGISLNISGPIAHAANKRV
jgi:hypothetical protein